MCDESRFPVVLIPEDYPYAAIIDTVHRYITFDTYNTINKLRLDKIMYEDLSDAKTRRGALQYQSYGKKSISELFLYKAYLILTSLR